MLIDRCLMVGQSGSITPPDPGYSQSQVACQTQASFSEPLIKICHVARTRLLVELDVFVSTTLD